MVIGYTTGVYDLFHVGHLNLFKNAKGMCDKLIVGVTVDELVQYKGKNAMIPFEDRIELVRSCKYVDAAVSVLCIIYYIAIARKKEFKILSIEEEIGEIDEPTAEEKAKIDKEYNIWKIGTSIVTIVALGIYLIPIIMN